MDEKTLKEAFSPAERPLVPAAPEARDLDLPETAETGKEPAAPEEQSQPETEAVAKAERSTVTPAAVPVAPAAKDRVLSEIEAVMAEDLTELFLKLSPEAQREFKAKGEETAGKIKQLLEQAKINVKVIFELVKKWLKSIPGVNHFFLEQEAKIKTDKILALAQEERRRAGLNIA
jgi:hypothetical protein